MTFNMPKIKEINDGQDFGLLRRGESIMIGDTAYQFAGRDNGLENFERRFENGKLMETLSFEFYNISDGKVFVEGFYSRTEFNRRGRMVAGAILAAKRSRQ